jgi:hypothetical protein
MSCLVLTTELLNAARMAVAAGIEISCPPLAGSTNGTHGWLDAAHSGRLHLLTIRPRDIGPKFDSVKAGRPFADDHALAALG